ncbi:hypothetical protein UR09_02905 [Candidatus Nitromaritima sp. SCGC AAA799-A02]|nr:hypothetical protein UR09_02905 [Candidatus Nitromaritima sp. SCGC AAA799-A02]
MDGDRLSEKANGRWDEIFTALYPTLLDAIQNLGKHVPCPRHQGKDGFRLFRDFRWTGGGICNTCGAFSNGFKLIMWLEGCGFDEAAKKVDFYFQGGHPFSTTRRKVKNDRWKWDKERTRFEKIFKGPIFPLGCKKYIEARGIKEVSNPALWLFEGRYYEDGISQGKFPCMAAKVTDEKGELIGVHKTYLNSDHSRKARVDSPKKMVKFQPNLTGGHIPLVITPGRTLLIVAEGIETALAIHSVTGYDCIATGNALMMEKLNPPYDYNFFLIAADKDRSLTGQIAAGLLLKRLERGIFKAAVLTPEGEIPANEKGIDWLDEIAGARTSG